MPFAKIPAKLKQPYGISIPITTACRITESHGEKAAALRQLSREIPETGGGQWVIGEVDGSMIPIVNTEHSEGDADNDDLRRHRQVEWKEARLALAYAKGTVNPIYGVTLGNAEQAGDVLLDCAIRAGFGADSKAHCVGDGASWLADQVSRVFALQGDYLIDFYHLCEYLADAAPFGAPQATSEWFEEHKAHMKDNRVSQVLKNLEAHLEPESSSKDTPVRRCYQYIMNREGQFDYKGALEAELPTGSDEVESAHRYVIQERLKRPGAWWKMKNANAMLALRELKANNEWDDYGDSQYRHAA